MSGYANSFDEPKKYVDEELLKVYNKVWNKIKNILQIKSKNWNKILWRQNEYKFDNGMIMEW